MSSPGRVWHMASQLLADSHTSFPRFQDGFVRYRPAGFEPRLLVYFEVWAVPLPGGTERQAERCGWGLMPVFDRRGEGYIRRGAYLVPVWVSDPPENLWQRLGEGDSADAVLLQFGHMPNDARDRPRDRLTYSSSHAALLVRLQDPQFDGLLAVRDRVYETDLLQRDSLDAFSLRAAAVRHNETPVWENVTRGDWTRVESDLRAIATRTIGERGPPESRGRLPEVTEEDLEATGKM